MIIRNVAWNWAGLIINGIVLFAMTPVMVHSLGNFYYGLWILANTFIGYYGLLDFGLTPTFQRFVSHYAGSGLRKGLDETFASALTLGSAIGLLCATLSLAVAAIPPAWLRIAPSQWPALRGLLMLLGVSVAVTFPGRTIVAYLRGLERFDLANQVTIAVIVLRSGVIVLLLKHGCGVLAVAWTTVAFGCAGLALNVVVLRRGDPELAFAFGNIHWGRIRELLNYSIFVFVITFGDMLRVNMDSFVVGRYLGVDQVTPYSIAGTFMPYFITVMGTLAGPLSATLMRINAEGNDEQTLAFFFRATRITSVMAMFIGMLLVVNGRSLLGTWMGPEFEYVYIILLVLVVGYVIDLAQQPSMSLIYARVAHKAMALWVLAEGLCNLALSIWLAKRFGLIGVAIGTAIPLLLVKLIIQPAYVFHKFGISAWQYFRKCLLGPLTASTLLMTACLLLHLHVVHQYLALAVRFGVQTLVYAVITFVFVFTAEERAMILSRLRRVANPNAMRKATS